MSKDEIYIRRCIQLAQNGICNTPPNPMVGAVIVCDDKIIGEGYHIRCGKNHAEVNAINSVKDQSLLKKATLYVSLEPCSHYGKTPPCADLIIQKRIPRVVVGCIDPFSLVAGRGIRKLQEAGTDVTVGVLEKDCLELIKAFVIFNTQKRPYITLKWAESADGFIDINRTEGSPIILSNAITSMCTHKQRAEHKAILVGRRTAFLDNPSLTTRHWYGDSPIRMVIDKDLSLPSSLSLFDESVLTFIFNNRYSNADRHNVVYYQLNFDTNILPQIAQVCYEQKIQSLLVEGGSQLLQSFLDLGYWDDLYREQTYITLNKGVKAPIITNGLFRKCYLHHHSMINYYENQNVKSLNSSTKN